MVIEFGILLRINVVKLDFIKFINELVFLY